MRCIGFRSTARSDRSCFRRWRHCWRTYLRSREKCGEKSNEQHTANDAGRNAMSDVLAIAAKSMADDMARMATISQNLANATTPGFKKDITVSRPFVEYLQAYGNAAQKTFVTSLPLPGTVVDYKPGSLRF